MTKNHNEISDSSLVGSLQCHTQILQSAGGGDVLRQAVQGYPVACFVTRMGSDMKVTPDRSLREKPGYNLS